MQLALTSRPVLMPSCPSGISTLFIWHALHQPLTCAKGEETPGVHENLLQCTRLRPPDNPGVSGLRKGRVGEEQLKFYQNMLLKPYAEAISNLTSDRVQLMEDFKELKNKLNVPKNLRKSTKSGFTNEQAVRVYLWNKIGEKIPGLSKRDLQELNDVIENDPQLQVFADEILTITKGDKYSKPGTHWLAGTITTDLISLLNTTKRNKYLP